MGDIEFSFYLYNPLAFLLVFGLPIIISIEILKKVRKKVYGDRRKPTVTYEEPKKNPSTFYNNQAAENELETQDKEHLDMFK